MARQADEEFFILSAALRFIDSKQLMGEFHRNLNRLIEEVKADRERMGLDD